MSSSEEEQIYSIALTMVPGIGHIGAKHLIDGMNNAVDVFRLRKEIPERIPEVSQRVVDALDCPQAVIRAEQEYEFIRKNRISCLTFHDEAYPSRLRECEDAPIVLFFKGNTDLNSLHILNMVGTRNATDYGTRICASFLRDLKTLCPDVLVVSGLAYGIDIHAHREALVNDLPTVGVLAHGLDRIYPYVHRKTAIDMLEKGGLLTEFLSGTNPDKHNFVSRNRIVAGMCDATVVIESAEKGGSLITAELAEGYHRDCFAFPGRINDEYSKGCNIPPANTRTTPFISSSKRIAFILCTGISASTTRELICKFPCFSRIETIFCSSSDKSRKRLRCTLLFRKKLLVYSIPLPVQDLQPIIVRKPYYL